MACKFCKTVREKLMRRRKTYGRPRRSTRRIMLKNRRMKPRRTRRLPRSAGKVGYRL